MLTLFKSRSLEERKTLVKAMITRMAEAYGIKKSALPARLECSKALINNWAYYGRTPYDYLERCREETGVSMDWLLYGSEPPPLQLEDRHIDAVKIIFRRILDDGVEYELMSEQCDGAVDRLSAKYDKDIDAWSRQLTFKTVVNDKD